MNPAKRSMGYDSVKRAVAAPHIRNMPPTHCTAARARQILHNIQRTLNVVDRRQADCDWSHKLCRLTTVSDSGLQEQDCSKLNRQNPPPTIESRIPASSNPDKDTYIFVQGRMHVWVYPTYVPHSIRDSCQED